MKAIKKNYDIFMLLFFVQLVFFIIVGTIAIDYSLAMSEQAQNILISLNDVSDPDLTPEQFVSYFNEDTGLGANYDLLKMNFIRLSVIMLLVWIIANGSNWTLSRMVLNSHVKYYHHMKLFIYISLILLIPLIIIFLIAGDMFTRSILADEVSFKPLYIYASIIFPAFFYFVAISYSTLEDNIIETIKNSFIIGIKKIHILLPLYLGITAIISIFFYLINIFMDSMFMFFFLALFLFSIVYLRIFFVKTVQAKSKI